MSNKSGHVIVSLPDEWQDYLLKLFPPQHPRVCKPLYITITHGRLPDDYPIPEIDRVEIYGQHLTQDAQCLVCTVNGEMFQPQRDNEAFQRPYHITISLPVNGHPERASWINGQDVNFLDPASRIVITGLHARRRSASRRFHKKKRHLQAVA